LTIVDCRYFSRLQHNVFLDLVVGKKGKIIIIYSLMNTVKEISKNLQNIREFESIGKIQFKIKKVY
jgi:hypothetical protein